SVSSKTATLKVFYANARSIRNKFSDLEELVFTENYDVIGITESWLNTEDRDFLAEYSLPGYVMFEKSRINRNGGGILLYIKESLNPTLLSKPQIVNIYTSFVLIKNNKDTKIILALT
ncbi:endonuclease/exonuclease/phosphatase family protein, partial [Pseudomonas aeruginosa]|uniref:endonuclease/exonuclease/phosphatase family protein n=1 Tax=Pseudomonas aeruginosa TaxID=287 RepID=UPI001CA56961